MLPDGTMYNCTSTIFRKVQNWTCLVILRIPILNIKNMTCS